MNKRTLLGFSLVETMISLVLISILIAGVMGTFFVLTNSHSNDRYYQALQISESVMDSVGTFRLKDSFKKKMLGYEIAVFIQETENCKKVNLNITWGSSSKLRNLDFDRRFYKKKNDNIFYSEVKN